MVKTRIIKRISVTPATPVTHDFLKVSRVLRTRIMRMGVTRTHLHGTREKFTHYSVTGVTVHLYGWGWVEDVSQNIHAYRVRAVRIISFYFILHPPPPFFIENYGTITIFVLLTLFRGGKGSGYQGDRSLIFI